MTNWYFINEWQIEELKQHSNKTQFDILNLVEKNYIDEAETIKELKNIIKNGI